MEKITIEGIIAIIQTNTRKLERGQAYSLEQLVGRKRWRQLPTTHRKRLGVEFKARAKNGELPVYWYERRSDNVQVYRIK